MLRETDLGCGPGDGMSILDGQVRNLNTKKQNLDQMVTSEHDGGREERGPGLHPLHGG